MNFAKTAMISFAGAVGVLTSGCATTTNSACMSNNGFNVGLVGVNKSHFDHDCNRARVANQMMQMDPATAAAGMAIAAADDPKLAKGIAATTDVLVKGQTNEQYKLQIDPVTGNGKLVPVTGKPVITVETARPASQPAAPAPKM